MSTGQSSERVTLAGWQLQPDADSPGLYVQCANLEQREAVYDLLRRAALSTPATTGEGEVEHLREMLAHVHDDLCLRAGREFTGLIRDIEAALAALPPSSGWEAGAVAMREAAASEVFDCWHHGVPSIDIIRRIKALPLPPPPSSEG